MNYYPIEQLVTWTGRGSQMAFAKRAFDLLPRRDEVLLEISAKGLTILAQTEEDLIQPAEFLTDVFGQSVRFSIPHVRLLYDDGWLQPIMGFRIEVQPVSSLRQVKHSLSTRSAEISNIELQTSAGVIRGEAPLVGLIGYPGSLQRLSKGKARATLWLSHYEPIWSYTNETMACYGG